MASHRPFGEPLGLASSSARPWSSLPPAPPGAGGGAPGAGPSRGVHGTPGLGGSSRDDASSEGDEARWLSEARLAGPSDGDDSEEAFGEREETVELLEEEAEEAWEDEEEGEGEDQGEEGGAWEGRGEGEGEDDEDAFARIRG